MTNFIKIDLGFYLVNKNKLKEINSKSVIEQKKIWDENVSTEFDVNVLRNICFDITPNKIDFRRKIYYKETEDIFNINKNIIKLYNILACCDNPLSKYFFLKPAFHLSTNNFNKLNKDSFLKRFYNGVYTPTITLDIEYSSSLYELDKNEFNEVIKDFIFLKSNTAEDDFSKINFSFLWSFLEYLDINNNIIILLKSI